MADLAKMKERVYKDPRPAEFFDRYHERSRTREPNWTYEFVRVCTSLWAWVFFRATCIAAEHVPAHGPVILAPNHFSFMDHFFCGAFIRRRVRFMAKSQLFKPPLVWIYSPGGVFPVRRGYADEEAFITAETVLEHGAAIVMYCEGGRSRSGKVGEEGARPGIGRLALESGAPIVPVAIYGSNRLRNWKKLQFPKVTVRYGEPFSFAPEQAPSRERQQAVADEILAHIVEIYGELESEGPRAVAARVRARMQSAAAA